MRDQLHLPRTTARAARRRARRRRGRDRGRVRGHAPRRKVAHGGGDDVGPPRVVERRGAVRVPRLVFERGGGGVQGDLPRARRLEIPVARLVVCPEVVGVPLRGGGEVRRWEAGRSERIYYK